MVAEHHQGIQTMIQLTALDSCQSFPKTNQFALCTCAHYIFPPHTISIFCVWALEDLEKVLLTILRGVALPPR